MSREDCSLLLPLNLSCAKKFVLPTVQILNIVHEDTLITERTNEWMNECISDGVNNIK